MGPVCGLGAFTAMIGLVLYFFLFYHLWLILINTTTNESFKWKDLRWALKELEKEKEIAVKNKSPRENSSDGAQKVPQVTAKKLVNIYNRGFLANFMEALLPYSLYGKGPANGGLATTSNSKSPKVKRR